MTIESCVCGGENLVTSPAKPNKSLQRDASTACLSSIFLAVKLCANRSARLKSGVMSPLRIESQLIPAASQLNAVRPMWLKREAG